MKIEELKDGIYLIKANDKDYPLTKEKEDIINSSDLSEEHKDFLKNLFNEPTSKSPDLLVELVGQNPFLKIKSIKNADTDEDITERYTSRDIDDVNCLFTLTKNLEWIPQHRKNELIKRMIEVAEKHDNLRNEVLNSEEFPQDFKDKFEKISKYKFKVGDKAFKVKGYKFPCTIVSVFETIDGNIRVVGEMDDYGLLHIFNEDQLERVD
jgi:hypothetical protein